MPDISLDMRQIIALALSILGVGLLTYAIRRNRKMHSPQTRLLIGFSIFVLVSALYVIENQLQHWFGIEEADVIANHITDFVWWIALTYLMTKVLDIVLWRGLLTHKGKMLVPMILVHATNILIFLIVALVFTRYILHKDITVLLTTSGVLLVALGYLAKAPFESAFAGLAINLAPMFKKGDFVQIGDSIGTVEDIGWQYVVLQTREEDRLFIPNLEAREKTVVNFGASHPTYRNEIEVTLEYAVPIHKGRALIESALNDLDDMIDKHLVFAMRYTDFGIVYKIHFWTSHKQFYPNIVHNINSTIFYKVQKEADVDFAYNKFLSLNATHISQKGATVHKAFVHETSLSKEQRVALLKHVGIFESLAEGEIETLATSSLVRVFGPPEKIIKQGDAGDSMFVIVKGRAQVYLKTKSDDVIELAIDKEGQYFGEMALLTGAVRQATVRAIDDVVLLEIPKAGMQTVLENRPSLAGDIATSVAERQSQNEALLSAHQEHQSNLEHNKTLADAIRVKVQHFFGLKDKVLT